MSNFIDVKDIGINAVSHSRMKTHEGCPRKAMFKFVQKLKEPGNEAMNRGLAMHKELEDWVNLTLHNKHEEGDTVSIPRTKIYDKIRSDLAEVMEWAINRWGKMSNEREYLIFPEQQVAFDKEWLQCDWFGANAWMRVVYDLTAYSPDKKRWELWDYKSGKVYDDHDQQADLYALSAFKQGAEQVTVKFYYLDKDMVQPYHYDVSEVAGLLDTILSRAAAVTEDRTWATNPSWKCKWCHFQKAKGGPCVH